MRGAWSHICYLWLSAPSYITFLLLGPFLCWARAAMQSSDPQSALVVVGLAVAVLSVFWTAAGVFATLLTKENGGVKAKED